MAAPALPRGAARPADGASPSAPPSALDTRWGKLLIPSLSDLFFLALIVWLFGLGDAWKGLLLDGDTGWHIRTGQYFLEHGSVPYNDIFSWSKPGEPWFAWEWLTDVEYAWLHARWGLGSIAVVSGVLICASAYVQLRVMLWMGANAFVSLVLTILYVGASSIHYHARPHIWTLLLFAVTVGLLVRDRQEPGRAIWLLVPLTCIWTNLHGGFLAAIACTGLAAVGVFLENPNDFRPPLRYLLLSAACLLASLVNPYGVQLHLHLLEYLQSEYIIDNVQEFLSPSFRAESVRQFEIALLAGLCCAGVFVRRGRYVEALWVLYFAHSALTSVRHVPLYMIVALPLIAAQGTIAWNTLLESRATNSIGGILHTLASDVAIGLRRTTVWIVVGCVIVLTLTTQRHFPNDFSFSFPVNMVAAHHQRFENARLFTSDQWGDYILYKLWPKQKVFMDGRSDYYGDALGKEYLSMMNADFKWTAITERYGFDLMLLPVKWPLASVLKLSPDWRLVGDDGKAILFERTNAPGEANGTNPKRRKY